MKMYDYLVAYKFNAEEYLTTCDGTIGISRKKKITNFDELNSVKTYIENMLKENKSLKGVTNVSIYNFILLGRNDHEEIKE